MSSEEVTNNQSVDTQTMVRPGTVLIYQEEDRNLVSQEKVGDVEYTSYGTRFLYTGPNQVRYFEMSSMVDESTGDHFTAVVLTEPVDFTKQNHEEDSQVRNLVAVGMFSTGGEVTCMQFSVSGDYLNEGTSEVSRVPAGSLGEEVGVLGEFIDNIGKSGPVKGKDIVQDSDRLVYTLMMENPDEISVDQLLL